MRNKILTAGLILAIAVSVVGIGSAYVGDAPKVVVEGDYIEAPVGSGESGMVGGYTAGYWDSAGGYKVDGTTVIDGDGDISVTDIDVTGTASVGEFTQGGGVYSYATSTGTTVLTEAELLAYNYIRLMVNTGTTATLTLPATSTMTTLIPNAGDTRSWLIENATSSAMTLTIAAGTGIDLIAYTTNDDVIDSTEYSELTCWRQADTDVTCLTSELLHAD